MKKLLIILAIISAYPSVLGQTQTKNYVTSTTYQVETQDAITNASSGQTLSNEEKLEVITYFDGLGRPIQSISKQAGGNRQDILTPIVYDALGRQVLDYLPYVRNGSPSLNFEAPTNSTLLDDLKSYYLGKFPLDLDINSPNPYSEKHFESSPLNRVLEQGAPGEDWKVDKTSDLDHTIKFEYLTNITNDAVKLFWVGFSDPNNTELPHLAYDNRYYTAGELYKTITKDENWISGNDHSTEEFKDKNGRVVLKRTYNNSSQHDTYYVYDSFGNLTYVLSPEGSYNILDPNNLVKQAVLNDLCYQYHYDVRNRLVEKKLPGKGWEFIVYDKLDRPVLTQDANLRLGNKWLFTKYDSFDRVTFTGLYIKNSTRSILQVDVNNQPNNTTGRLSEIRTATPTFLAFDSATVMYYTNSVFPFALSKIYTINYYDDYLWDTRNSFEAIYVSKSDPHSGITIKNEIKKESGYDNLWDSGFTTNTKIIGDGYIQWTIQQIDKRVMVGLSKTDSAPDNNYTTIDYAIYTGENNVKIYEEGIGQYLPDTYCAIGDVFRVERSGSQIYYYKNGQIFHASTTPSTGSLVGDSSFRSIGASISNVFIGYSTQGQPFAENAKGLSTGSKIRILDTDPLTTNIWITNAVYYDHKARPIFNTAENKYLNTFDVTSNKLDFIGKTIKTHSTHRLLSKKGGPIVVQDAYFYDHQGRLLRQVQKINNENEQLIAKNNYDELGQLQEKQVGGALPNISSYTIPQNVTLNYNIITKSGVDGWNAGLATQEIINGDGYVSFLVPQLLKSLVVGLSYMDTNLNYNTINYGIFIRWDGAVVVYENGVDRGQRSTYVPGDIFIVERRKNSIYYIKNGETFYVSQTPTAPNSSMLGDLSMHTSGAMVKNLVLVDLGHGLQDVDYAYNIRGWLKTINNPNNLATDLFGFKLNYNSADHGAEKVYNGNISETEWRTSNTDNSQKWYKYTYDALNRITNAMDNINRYTLSSVLYDKNGNINSLSRGGHTNANATSFGVMDNLSYIYTPNTNRLKKVTDTGNTTQGFKDGSNIATEYTYDSNGNMLRDYNKGMSANILYNHLNLPTRVSFGSGNIIYIYDATGVKIEKVVTEVTKPIKRTKYAGNYVYEKTGTADDMLKFFSQPEGYVEPKTPSNYKLGFDYVYQYKDHLGNIRLSYADTDGSYQSLVNSAFYEDFEGWVFSGGAANGSIQTENGRLKTNVKYQYNGVQIIVSENFSPGDDVSLEIDIDKGNTNIIRAFLIEYDINDNLLGYYKVNSNVATGHYVFDHTMVGGTKLVFKVDKSNLSSDIGQETYFFIDEVYAAKGELQIVEENNYYPFGLQHKGYNNVVNGVEHPYGFGGKEEQDELGLGWIDITARNYDPALGRWMNVDPLAEERQGISPYNYVQNNPLNRIDPTGMLDTHYEDEFGTTLADTYDGNDATVVVASENVKAFQEDFNNTSVMHQDGVAENAEWIGKYGEGMVAQEGATVQSWAVEAMGHDTGYEGVTVAAAGLGLSAGQSALKGATFRLFNNKGTNFSPKLYRSGWNGGSAGRIKTYGGAGKALSVFGKFLGAYNAYSVNEQYKSGQISKGRMQIEQASNLFSTFGGIYGASWGVGWEAGKVIGPSTWYGNDDSKWFE